VGLNQIPNALRVFEEVRKPRTSEVRRRTLDQKAKFALDEGPEQKARDVEFRAGVDHGLFQWLWEYDAVRSGKEAWKRVSAPNPLHLQQPEAKIRHAL
jgi:salicylate hydroxylase